MQKGTYWWILTPPGILVGGALLVFGVTGAYLTSRVGVGAAVPTALLLLMLLWLARARTEIVVHDGAIDIKRPFGFDSSRIPLEDVVKVEAHPGLTARERLKIVANSGGQYWSGKVKVWSIHAPQAMRIDTANGVWFVGVKSLRTLEDIEARRGAREARRSPPGKQAGEGR